jgi:hypothetical protein
LMKGTYLSIPSHTTLHRLLWLWVLPAFPSFSNGPCLLPQEACCLRFEELAGLPVPSSLGLTLLIPSQHYSAIFLTSSLPQAHLKPLSLASCNCMFVHQGWLLLWVMSSMEAKTLSLFTFILFQGCGFWNE